MSQFEKELREELTIRKAKYRVKNSAGKYEVVYLETSADQVEQTSDRVFVTPDEKSQIISNKEAIAAETQARETAVNGLSGRLDVIEGDSEGSINKALQDAKTYTDGKVLEVNGANSALSKRVEANEAALGTVDTRIATAKGEAINTSNAHTTSEIAKIDAAYKAADTKVLEDAKADAQAKVQEAKTTLQGNIDTLAGRVSTNESEISKLKDAVSNKNSNTVVVETEDEIATSNPTPKVGDLAYVISSKRAYIYKGATSAVAGDFKAGETVVGADLIARTVPQGWVVFDEITSELDLVNYLKKDEAEATYRKLSDKIAEADLATELSTKINNKADKSYVDTQLEGKATEAYVNSKVEEVVAPVRTESAQNKANIAKEVSDRTAEITRVEGLVSNINNSLTEKETALKAEDTKLNNRINKFVPVVAKEEPTETEAGHVWLQLV